MRTNPLMKQDEINRPKLTLEERCDQANAQLILKGINEDRRAQGLFPVKWVIADHTIKLVAA